MFKQLLCSFVLCVFGSLCSASAATFDVTFDDSTGPYWTGQVNTTSDTLSINSWIENDGFPEFWTPNSLPLNWNAVDRTGASYNVPDNWDGTIGADWGFLSPVSLSSMSFSDGSIDDTWSGSSWKPGWGIWEKPGYIEAMRYENDLPIWPRYANYVDWSVAESVEISTVVPIPGAVWLLGSGFIGLLGLRKKFKS